MGNAWPLEAVEGSPQTEKCFLNLKRKSFCLIMLLLIVGIAASLFFGEQNALASEIPGPIVSFTFDDGYDSIYADGLPVFQQYNIAAGTYVITDKVGTGDYISLSQLQEMQQAGWEISSHTADHNGITEDNVSRAKQWLDSNGFTNSGFAAPNGIYTEETVSIVEQYHPYYVSTWGINSRPFDPYNIVRKTGLNNGAYDIEGIKALLDQAVDQNLWIVFVNHPVSTSSWGITPQRLEEVIQEIQTRNIPVVTVGDVVNGSFPPDTLGRYEETDPNVSWTGNWYSYSDPQASSGSRRFSSDYSTPATCTFSFTGTSVT